MGRFRRFNAGNEWRSLEDRFAEIGQACGDQPRGLVVQPTDTRAWRDYSTHKQELTNIDQLNESRMQRALDGIFRGFQRVRHNTGDGRLAALCLMYAGYVAFKLAEISDDQRAWLTEGQEALRLAAKSAARHGLDYKRILEEELGRCKSDTLLTRLLIEFQYKSVCAEASQRNGHRRSAFYQFSAAANTASEIGALEQETKEKIRWAKLTLRSRTKAIESCPAELQRDLGGAYDLAGRDAIIVARLDESVIFMEVAYTAKRKAEEMFRVLDAQRGRDALYIANGYARMIAKKHSVPTERERWRQLFTEGVREMKDRYGG